MVPQVFVFVENGRELRAVVVEKRCLLVVGRNLGLVVGRRF